MRLRADLSSPRAKQTLNVNVVSCLLRNNTSLNNIHGQYDKENQGAILEKEVSERLAIEDDNVVYVTVSSVSHHREKFSIVETKALLGQNRPKSAMRAMPFLRTCS